MNERSAPEALDARRRDAVLDRLERERFDLVIAGGGISGAGLAREAALRGLRVALLESDDYAEGTSSRSSKLIHGGLRYLAQGEVALVRATALERRRIHRLAPHLAEPRWQLVPARSRAGLAKLRAGITAYEKLGGVEGADLHRNWDAADLAREEPLLDTRAFPFACAYREYLTDDAHLVLANLRSAAALGAAIASRAPVTAVCVEGGRATGVEATCRASGRRLRVRARCVVNAAGPWVETILRLEDPGAAPMLHLSKGVHVVLPADHLPVRHMLVLVASDRRSVFVIRRGGGVYVGTTDTSHPRGVTHWPAVERADVEYLLAPLARALRAPPPRPEDVGAAWAGLRPLLAEPGKAPAEISRRDEVRVGPAGVVTLAGGKLTGYRPMARRTLEVAAGSAGLRPAPPPGEEPPLPGGDFDGDLDALAERVARGCGVERPTAERLVRLYGTEALEVASDPTPLVPGAPVLAAEVDWAVDREGAAGVEDVLYRHARRALRVGRPGGRGGARRAAPGRTARLERGPARRRGGPDARAARRRPRLPRRGGARRRPMQALTGWRITGVGALVLTLLFAAVMAIAGTDEAGLRALVRFTARCSLLVFLPVYTASSLRRLWPSSTSRWLLRNRRFLGVTFAWAHGLHALAIGLLALLLGDAFRVPLPILAVGGAAYALLAAMVATSSDRAVRALGPRRWKALHRTGIHLLWLVFAFDWTANAAASAAYLPLAALVWGAAALRLGALRARRPASAPAAATGS